MCAGNLGPPVQSVSPAALPVLATVLRYNSLVMCCVWLDDDGGDDDGHGDDDEDDDESCFTSKLFPDRILVIFPISIF